MDVHVKFGDSRSNGFQDSRGADFVSNERTNEQDEAYPNSVKRFRGVSPEKKNHRYTLLTTQQRDTANTSTCDYAVE